MAASGKKENDEMKISGNEERKNMEIRKMVKVNQERKWKSGK